MSLQLPEPGHFMDKKKLFDRTSHRRFSQDYNIKIHVNFLGSGKNFFHQTHIVGLGFVIMLCKKFEEFWTRRPEFWSLLVQPVR